MHRILRGTTLVVIKKVSIFEILELFDKGYQNDPQKSFQQIGKPILLDPWLAEMSDGSIFLANKMCPEPLEGLFPSWGPQKGVKMGG